MNRKCLQKFQIKDVVFLAIMSAVADRAPLAAVGMTLAVVAVSALGALIGIKIARELKKSGVLKK